MTEQEKVEIIVEADRQVKADGFIPSDRGTQSFLEDQGIFVSPDDIKQALENAPKSKE